MAPLSPEQLVRRCQQTLPEDTRAFEQLVTQHKGLVFRTALGILGNRQDAEDQAQEVFVKVYRGIRDLDDPFTFVPWLYRVTTNTCLDALRKKKRAPQQETLSESEDGDVPEVADEKEPTPEQHILTQELRRCLEATLAQMDANSRTVLVLCDIENRPYKEISENLGIGLSAVKMRIHRIRSNFQRLLNRICPDVWAVSRTLPRARGRE